MNMNNVSLFCMSNYNHYNQVVKQRIKAMEAQEEEDYRLMNEEYNDDYDDQFDEPAPLSMTLDAGDDNNNSSSTSSKKQSKKAAASAPKINWEVRMKVIKRVNQILRSEEEEEKFWASMRNTNHDKQ